MNTEEINALYKQHENLIYDIIWKTLKSQPSLHTQVLDFDDFLSVANLSFITAAHRYRDIAEFTTWIHKNVSKYLQTYIEKENRELEKIYKPRERNCQPKHNTQPPIDWWEELSEDSRMLISYVYSGELKLDKFINKTKYTSVRHVTRFLRKKKWETKRINRCFRDIKRVLL